MRKLNSLLLLLFLVCCSGFFVVNNISGVHFTSFNTSFTQELSKEEASSFSNSRLAGKKIKTFFAKKKRTYFEHSPLLFFILFSVYAIAGYSQKFFFLQTNHLEAIVLPSPIRGPPFIA